MSDACAIAFGAASALGLGHEAFRSPSIGDGPRVGIAFDSELAAAGLRRPNLARVTHQFQRDTSGDRATDLLVEALSQTIVMLDRIRPGWRSERLGIAIGTSSGGMLSAERFFAERTKHHATQSLSELARNATYFAPFNAALSAFGLGHASRCTQLLAACAASTFAMGLALRWLDRGVCDLVIAGGYDGVSVFVAAGFEALRATTASLPRPFRLDRDGMALGEGAGLVALVREDQIHGAPVWLRLAGFGASTDAVHITAPDRTGSGLARAAAQALADAGWPASRVGLVSAHATATPYNDAMESRAIQTIFASAQPPVVHPFKAQIGHTLGAAGILEALAISDALTHAVAPPAASQGNPDPDAPALLLDRAEAHPSEGALKLSAAFGGSNAALLLTATPSGRRQRQGRSVYLRAHVHITSANLDALSAATAISKDRLARLDTLCRLGLAAVAALAADVGQELLRGAGIIAGHSLATLDTNEMFDSRRRTRGAMFVEPRVFPATSPNAVAGECAIAYQLTGPSFAVGAGLGGAMEALRAAADLVAASDADRMVVVAADTAGPVSRQLLDLIDSADRPLAQGAVALLLQADAGHLQPLREIDLDFSVDHTGPAGHLALLRWLDPLTCQ